MVSVDPDRAALDSSVGAVFFYFVKAHSLPLRDQTGI